MFCPKHLHIQSSALYQRSTLLWTTGWAGPVSVSEQRPCGEESSERAQTSWTVCEDLRRHRLHGRGSTPDEYTRITPTTHHLHSIVQCLATLLDSGDALCNLGLILIIHCVPKLALLFRWSNLRNKKGTPNFGSAVRWLLGKGTRRCCILE